MMMDGVSEQRGQQQHGGAEHRLVELFREMGCDAEGLHADAFERLLGFPSMRIQAFLDWFATSLRPRQSVRHRLKGDRDYAIYLALLHGEDGQRLLQGDELRRAEMACQVDFASAEADRGESLDALLAGNRQLEDELEVLERRLRAANDRNERLARLVQRETGTADARARRDAPHEAPQHFAELHTRHSLKRRKPVDTDELLAGVGVILQHLSTEGDSTTLTKTSANASAELAVISPLTSNKDAQWTREVTDRLESVVAPRGERRQPKDFLYRHSLRHLEELERDNLQSLKGQIPLISGANGASKNLHQTEDVNMSPAKTVRRPNSDAAPPSPWLHESGPHDLHLRDQDAILYNKCSAEVERLRRAFVIGERDALIAEVQLTSYECHLRQLATTRRSLVQQFQLMSQDAVWARKNILRSSIEKSKQQIAQLMMETIPARLEELAMLKSTTVLLQSYEQKLWRQENRFIKLRNLLEAFEVQHARLTLVHCLLDGERHDILEVEKVLGTLVARIQQTNDHTSQRLKSFGHARDGDVALNMLSQAYLDERDEVAHSLFDVLHGLVHGHRSEQSNGFAQLRTFDELVRLSDHRCANETSIRDTLAQLRNEWGRLYESKRSTLDVLRLELFGDFTSSTPLLLPLDLAALLHESIGSKDHTEQEIQAALEQLRLYKRSMSADPSNGMQQQRNYAKLKRLLADKSW